MSDNENEFADAGGLPPVKSKKDTKTIAQHVRDALMTNCSSGFQGPREPEQEKSEDLYRVLAPKTDRIERAAQDLLFENYVEKNNTRVELDEATAAKLGRLAVEQFLGNVRQARLSLISKESSILPSSQLATHDQREEVCAFLYTASKHRAFAVVLADVIRALNEAEEAKV